MLSFAYLLLFISGAAALGYEIVWTRQFAGALGHEAPAMLAVLCGFMGGMAAGAGLLGARIARTPHPLRWYAVLELVIGVWALVLIAVIPLANGLALKMLGPDPGMLRGWLVAFVFPTLLLLPSTAAMGATFPAMERFASAAAGKGSRVGAVYAANTAGAVAGVLAVTFFLMPQFGFSRTALVLAGLNLLCGAVAWAISRSARPALAPITAAQDSEATALTSWPLRTVLFITGFLAIGFQVGGTRVLSQVLENTIYSFAAVLSIYLLGSSLGAVGYQRFSGKRQSASQRDNAGLLATLLSLCALACLSGVIALPYVPHIYERLRSLGNSIGAVLLAESVSAAMVFLLPTIVMGALFSHLVHLLRTLPGGVGRALALNTVGSALAPIVLGALVLPLLGSKWALVLIVAVYLALSPRWTRLWIVAAVVCSAALLVIPPRLHSVTVPPGGSVVQFREGVLGAVSVVADAAGERALRVNNRFQMGGTAVADAEYRAAHIPLLLHPAPRRALFLGLGTGITLAGGTLYPDLTLDGIELLPEVVELLPLFEPHNRGAAHFTNVNVTVADARRFIATTTNLYDVIVADLFHPGRDGAGLLYTVEHFQRIAGRLNRGGLFCQWLPLHQLDGRQLAIIARSFQRVFATNTAVLLRLNIDVPVLGLIGGAGFEFAVNPVEARSTSPVLASELKRLGLSDSLRLFGLMVDVSELARSPGLLNTDDHPVITFEAPRIVYADAAPYAALTNVIATSRPAASHASLLRTEARFNERLAAFIVARDSYLRGLVLDDQGHRAEALSAYVESARLSEDFTLGYAQCLSMAAVLAKSNPAEAQAILERLIEAQPGRPVAREFLRRLNAPQQE